MEQQNQRFKVNPNLVRDLLGHPVHLLGVPVVLLVKVPVDLSIVKEVIFPPDHEGFLHEEKAEMSHLFVLDFISRSLSHLLKDIKAHVHMMFALGADKSTDRLCGCDGDRGTSYVQGRAKKFLLSLVREVPFGLMGCVLAAYVSLQQ